MNPLYCSQLGQCQLFHSVYSTRAFALQNQQFTVIGYRRLWNKSIAFMVDQNACNTWFDVECAHYLIFMYTFIEVMRITKPIETTGTNSPNSSINSPISLCLLYCFYSMYLCTNKLRLVTSDTCSKLHMNNWILQFVFKMQRCFVTIHSELTR